MDIDDLLLRAFSKHWLSHLTAASHLTCWFNSQLLHTSWAASYLTGCFTPHGPHLLLMGHEHSLTGHFTPHGLLQLLHTSWATFKPYRPHSHLMGHFTPYGLLHTSPAGSQPMITSCIHGLAGCIHGLTSLMGCGKEIVGDHLRTMVSTSTGPRGFCAQHWGGVVGVGSHQGFEHSWPHRNMLSTCTPTWPQKPK